LVAGPVALNLANQVALAALGALALTVLMGAAGQISLGHAALLAAGGFTVGVLTQEVGAPAWVILPAAITAGAALGFVVGLPSLRLRGIYLALSTLALHFAVLYLASEYQTQRRLSTGIVLPDPAFGPLVVHDPRVWYVVLIGVLALAIALCRNLLGTRTGRAWLALRERDVAASSVGVDVARYKLLAFVVSAALTSFAGALGAYYQHFVAADGYTFFLTVQYLAMVLIGGSAQIAGAITGAAFVVLLPQAVTLALGALPVPPQFKLYTFALQYVLFGLLMAGFILFEPGGLTALWTRFRSHRNSAVRGSTPRLQAIVSPAPRHGLAVANLTVGFGAAAPAVKDLSLDVPRGAIVALLGANGAGKSTTLRAIGGLLPSEPARIASGRIVFDGVDLTGLPPHQVARAGVALVSERDKIFSTLTVEQNLALAPGARDQLVMSWFPALGARRTVRAGSLSGGERQMLALACALQARPRLLLVDELSLGLAPALVRSLMRIIDDVRRQLGLTVLLVEQNVTAALAVADYAYVLTNGVLTNHGPAPRLLGDPRLQSLYLSSPRVEVSA
jgi:branched-chain amino acid transport system permease protein